MSRNNDQYVMPVKYNLFLGDEANILNKIALPGSTFYLQQINI
jgi:hypothetical protein